MAVTVHAHDLTTDPPTYAMSGADRRSFTFSLPSTHDDGTPNAATLGGPGDVALRFQRVHPGIEVLAGVASVVGVAGRTATVLVEANGDFNRGEVFELRVTLTGSDGNTETLFLFVPCPG